MPRISIVDNSNSIEAYGMDYAYLSSRVKKALSQVGIDVVLAPITSRLASVTDVQVVLSNKDEFLAVLLGKGKKDQARTLANAAHASQQGLDEQLRKVFSDEPGVAGLTFGRLSLVPTVRCLPFEGEQKANRTFISNLLIHEIGHAVSGNSVTIHDTGAVMKSTIENSDPELSYSPSFMKFMKKKLGTSPKPNKRR